uniref:Uncharacterized protein n=1 Tax=Plectus sambesii TaxID=2011161 RepID=A0A914WIK9_9BILA
MKDEEASLVPCTANPLAKSEVSSTASFIASNGDVLQLRKNKPSFVIEDDSSMMGEIGPVHHSSSSSDLPIMWYKDGEGTGSLVALLSALYALVLIIFSVIFELSILLKAKRITEMPWLYECFHIYLYSAGLAFFGYCYGFMLHRGWIRDIRTKDQRIRGSLR